jgi:hypothetical protein
LILSVYILLGLLIVALELPRRFRGRPIDAMTIFNCYYFVLYVFVPINVIYLGDDVVRQKYAYDQFGYGDLYTALSLYVSYALFCLGYWATSIGNSTFSAYGGGRSFNLRNSANVAKIIFLFGVLAMAVHVVQIGGVLEVISKASQVRSGELVIESKFLFFRFFTQFLADAFVLYYAVLVGKRANGTKIKTAEKVILLVTFVFFVYYALSTGGRRSFIYPAILCYLVYASVGGGGVKATVALLGLTFIIAGLGTMMGSIGSDENWSAVLETAYTVASQGLGDTFIHFVGAQNADLWQFGFLTDIVNLPLDFFPSQLLGFERSRHMYGAVSEFFLGHQLVEGLSGEETLGLHGYLLVNFGYMGMFALFFILGLFYKWIHTNFKPAVPKDAIGWLIYWWIVFGFFVYFREGVLIFVLKQQLTWWITIALLLYKAKKVSIARIEHWHGESSLL